MGGRISFRHWPYPVKVLGLVESVLVVPVFVAVGWLMSSRGRVFYPYVSLGYGEMLFIIFSVGLITARYGYCGVS